MDDLMKELAIYLAAMILLIVEVFLPVGGALGLGAIICFIYAIYHAFERDAPVVGSIFIGITLVTSLWRYPLSFATLCQFKGGACHAGGGFTCNDAFGNGALLAFLSLTPTIQPFCVFAHNEQIDPRTRPRQR